MIGTRETSPPALPFDLMLQPAAKVETAPALDDRGLTARVARFFVVWRGCWIRNSVLAYHFGCGAWRTEISRCRRRYGMTIRQRYVVERTERHGVVRHSEYRLE